MQETTNKSVGTIRFGPFELGRENFELRRNGRPIRIEKAPLELLLVLAERPGKLVSQREAAQLVWGSDVHIETDSALYTAIGKIRRALSDTSRKPKYIETVARKGYRFVAPLSHAASPRARPEETRPMLAVLPLENLSGIPKQEYFSDGLTEELITELGRISPGELGVIARTSIMRYKRSSKSIREIARELGANYLIEGSVRTVRGTVRIAVQLIRASDQSHVWAGAFQGPLREVFRVQEDVARAVAQEIRVRLTKKRPATLEVDPELYDMYLRGRFAQSHLIKPAVLKAIGYFEKLLHRSRNFAPAWIALAECYTRLPITSDVGPREAFPKARQAIEAAIRLDSSAAEAYAVSGLLEFWHTWDWEKAEADTLRAQACNPSCSNAYLWRAHVLSNLGRHREALAEVARAKELDPFSRIVSTLHGQFHYQAGPEFYAQAESLLRYALQIDPHFWVAHIDLAKIWGMQGKYREAVKAAERAYRFSHGNTEGLAVAGWSLAKAGKSAQARRKVAELEGLAKKTYVPPLHRALIHIGLGEARQALGALEYALEDRDVRLTFLRVEPRWDPLRGDPRFQKILARVNLAAPA